MKPRDKEFARRRRHRRVRKKIMGTPGRPRLAVYRSNRHVYAQLIDDLDGRTLAAASTLKDAGANGSPKDRARAVGEAIAKKAKSVGISSAVFDRGGFAYHGQVREVAEAARGEGLTL